MAQIKISELPSATGVGDSDFVPIVQDGTTKKATVDVLKRAVDLSDYQTKRLTETIFTPEDTVESALLTVAQQIDGKETKGQLEMSGGIYLLQISTTDEGTPNCITFVLEE